MALASYFSKNLLSLAQVLHCGSGDQLAELLDKHVVGIGLGDGVKNREGIVALDLSVRLLARLYPKMRFIDLAHNQKKTIAELKKKALSINQAIEFPEVDPTVILTIGSTHMATKDGVPVFYIGSDRWVSHFSVHGPKESGDSNIPFGAGISACIGASNIFRFVFAEFLENNEFDEEFSLSLLTLDSDSKSPNPVLSTFDVGRVHLAGFGAIGNGFMWALTHCPFLKAELIIVEPEKLENNNLQRYILALEEHVNLLKNDIATALSLPKKIKLRAFPGDWAAYLQSAQDWKNELVVIAVDNIPDRLAIQGSLPKELINAYTENNVLGVSRHLDFVNDACLVCTSLTQGGGISHSQEVANNLRLGDRELMVRDYFYYNKPLDDQLLQLLAASNHIDVAQLDKYKGLGLREFYSAAVCGGVLLALRNENSVTEQIEAPLAFQSAMAGILELSELVISRAKLRTEKFPNVTQFYPLLQVSSRINPYNHSLPKDDTGKCICNDADYRQAYLHKWK